MEIKLPSWTIFHFSWTLGPSFFHHSLISHILGLGISNHDIWFCILSYKNQCWTYKLVRLMLSFRIHSEQTKLNELIQLDDVFLRFQRSICFIAINAPNVSVIVSSTLHYWPRAAIMSISTNKIRADYKSKYVECSLIQYDSYEEKYWVHSYNEFRLRISNDEYSVV